jgi:hypothetical protein
MNFQSIGSVAVANATLTKSPNKNGVIPKATAFSMPTKFESHTNPQA